MSASVRHRTANTWALLSRPRALEPYSPRTSLAVHPKTVALADGTKVVLRLAQFFDRRAVGALIGRMEPDDQRSRYFTLLRCGLGEPQMLIYANPNPFRCAILAFDAAHRPVGSIVVCLDPLSREESDALARSGMGRQSLKAEIGYQVDASVQRRGLGRALLERALEICHARGIRTAGGPVLRSDLGRASRGLLASQGATFANCPDDWSCFAATIDVAEWAKRHALAVPQGGSVS